jgi:hypothetical protein
MDVEECGARHRDVHPVDRDEAAADGGPHHVPEEQPREDRAEEHDERAREGRGEPPAPRPHPEELLAEPDLPFPEVGVDVGADVPPLLPEQLLGVVEAARLVALADQDAAGLRVVELVEHERVRM